MAQEEQDHRIDYIEFPVTDVEAAKRFYAAVFGWSFTDYGPDYTCFADGRLNGGFAKTADLKAGGPLVVLYAQRLSATLDAVKANGGKVTKEIFEFPGGKRFHFRDPAGHELGVWSDK